MQRNPTGLLIVAVGVGLVVIGLLAWSGALSWFGRLPGDIRVERENARLYVPITSMLLVSVAISVVAAIVRRLWP
jgi:1-acyl-sn-glycerol-3-phosphate acyltransferase